MTDKPKRKRGRPKKQPVKVPTFENDNDIRQFLINESLRLNVELIELFVTLTILTYFFNISYSSVWTPYIIIV